MSVVLLYELRVSCLWLTRCMYCAINGKVSWTHVTIIPSSLHINHIEGVGGFSNFSKKHFETNLVSPAHFLCEESRVDQ